MNGTAHYREAENCARQGCAADERGAQADAMGMVRARTHVARYGDVRLDMDCRLSLHADASLEAP